MDLYQVNLGKWELHFSEFLSYCFLGLESNTKKMSLRNKRHKWRSGNYTLKVCTRQTPSTDNLHMLLLMYYLTLLVLRTTWAHSSSVPTGFPSLASLSLGQFYGEGCRLLWESLASLKLEILRDSVKFQFVLMGSNLTLWIPVCPYSILLQI